MEYLNIFAWMIAENLFIVHSSPKDKFSRSLDFRQYRASFVWTKDIHPKMAVVVIWTIISLEICVKGMANWLYRTRSLMVRFNCSISVTCSFLDTQMREMIILDTSGRSDYNSLSACMKIDLEPMLKVRFIDLLDTILNVLHFPTLIILPVANKIFRGILIRNPIPLMFMRSQHRVTLLYLSRIPLGYFGTMTGSTWWTFWWPFCLVNVANWVHKFLQPFWNILRRLGNSEGCCCQLHGECASLVGRLCAKTIFRSQLFLHHGPCTASSSLRVL